MSFLTDEIISAAGKRMGSLSAAIGRFIVEPFMMLLYSLVVGLTSVQAANSITTALNATGFNAGQTLTLSRTMVAAVPAANGDVYIGLQLPDGTLLIMQPDGSFTTAIVPYIANTAIQNVTGPIFNYTFAGTEPTGSYTWYAGIANPGTLVFPTPLVTSTFTFASAPSIITGTAYLGSGAVAGGTVTAYQLTNGAKGVAIAAAVTTDAQGGFQMNLGAYNGPLLLELTTNGAATYLDTATGTRKLLANRSLYRTLMSSVPAQPVAITVLTEMATYGALLNGGTTLAINNANTAVQQNYLGAGADLRFTIPADLSVAQAGSAAAENYASILASFSAMVAADPAAYDLQSFTQAFDARMGITEAALQTNFYTIMSTFLR